MSYSSCQTKAVTERSNVRGFGLNLIPFVLMVNNNDTNLQTSLKRMEIDFPYKMYNFSYFLFLRGHLPVPAPMFPGTQPPY